MKNRSSPEGGQRQSMGYTSNPEVQHLVSPNAASGGRKPSSEMQSGIFLIFIGFNRFSVGSSREIAPFKF